MKYALELTGVSKTYNAHIEQNKKKALQDVYLKIPSGSIFGLLGPNGAGKSTLINIVAGLTNKSSGSVSIWGYDQDKNPERSRAFLGVVPQELNLDPFLSPKEALEIQAGLFGVPKNQRQTLKILEKIGLGEVKNAYARSLSGGMRRRLLMAKALVHSPPLLILDEPTAGVDIELREMLWNYIFELRELGTTIILTTHYLEEAEALCDHVAIIDKGNVITSKPKHELMRETSVKDLHLTLTAPPPNPLPEALIALGAEWQDGKLQIQFNPREISAGAIISKVTTLGLEIGDVSTQESDLEDVFLSLTK